MYCYKRFIGVLTFDMNVQTAESCLFNQIRNILELSQFF